MPGRMGKRSSKMAHARPVGDRGIFAGQPAFDSESGNGQFVDAASRRMLRDEAGGGLTKGAGADREADRCDAPSPVERDVERDAAAARARAPLDTRVGVGKAGMLRRRQGEPEDIAGIESRAHVAVAAAGSGSFNRSATISDRAALVARSSG